MTGGAETGRAKTLEDIWLARAKRIQALASTGLFYTDPGYDQERYQELAVIAQEMLADLGSVPVARIENLVPDFATGYVTPRVDVRGAVVEDGQVLLVREKTDGKWALPGGFADVGFSPAENVVKEIREEAGLSVRAEALYRVRHKAKAAYAADARDFYKLFFICTRLDAHAPRPGPETLDAAFFRPDDVPDLSTGRTIADDIADAVAFAGGDMATARFD